MIIINKINNKLGLKIEAVSPLNTNIYNNYEFFV